MKEYSISLREKIKKLDPVVLLAAVGMNIMSVVTLAGASDKYGTWYVKIQILASVVSFAVMLFIAFLDYDAIVTKLRKFFFPITVLLIVWVIFFGTGSFGNDNWITIKGTNISFQPTEFSKITYMLTFALHLEALRDKINHPLSILALGLHAGIIVGLVLIQGDLGMALVYLAITAIMLFGAGVSIWYFIGVITAAALASPLIWPQLTTKQQNRILYGFNPDLDPLGAGWQAISSRNCIVAGGFRGAGFDGGTKYFSLTQGQSDFIFAVLAEKFGFIGTFLYVTLITVLILRILWISKKARRPYAAFLCVGIAGMMIAQAVENIGMCLGLLPVVGITLPFMSYGASSILSMYVSVGLVQSISTHRDQYYFESEE